MADHLEDLLDLLDETRMIDGLGKLDMTKVSGTLGHVLEAGGALELAVDGAKTRVVQTLSARFRPGLVHGLGVDDVDDTHVLGLLGREETELDLLHRLDGRIGMRKVKVGHGGW